MGDYHNSRAKEILQTLKYATIATASVDGKPWNGPVAHVIDSELNIYWFSDKEAQHSRNVRANERVFIVIYDSTVPYGKGEGVYIEALAHELTDREEIKLARHIKKGADVADSDEFMGDAVRRVYKAVPQRVWMNTDETVDGVFIRDVRVEVSLELLRG